MVLGLTSIRSAIASSAPPAILNSVVRFVAYGGNLRRAVFGLRQIEFDEKNPGLRVLLIGPGEKRIPVSGWGAVELVISNQMTDLRKQGFSVDLLNSWNLIDWLRCFRRKPQVVICHYDVFAFRSRLFSKLFNSKNVTLTHYAYAQQPNRWDPQFHRYAEQISKSDAFVALNDTIASVFSKMYPQLHIVVIPNGIDLMRFNSKGDHKGALCLGKVEPRKRQVQIARQLTGAENISFVGDIVDPEFANLSTEQKQMFLGPWSRNQVETLLCQYSTLFLLGDGEADALVLYEAQAAGLRILTNEVSVGSQKRDLDWIRVVTESEELPELLLSSGSSASTTTPNQIANYAASNYKSEASNAKYADLIRSLI